MLTAQPDDGTQVAGVHAMMVVYPGWYGRVGVQGWYIHLGYGRVVYLAQHASLSPTTVYIAQHAFLSPTRVNTFRTLKTIHRRRRVPFGH